MTGRERADAIREELRLGAFEGYCTWPPELLLPAGSVVIIPDAADTIEHALRYPNDRPTNAAGDVLPTFKGAALRALGRE